MSRYGMISVKINNDLRDSKAPPLTKNNDLRKFAYGQYKNHGLSDSEAKKRMDKKDAGHIKALNCGGKNKNNNYIWEDRHDNRAHKDHTITNNDLIRAGRKHKNDLCMIM